MPGFTTHLNTDIQKLTLSVSGRPGPGADPEAYLQEVMARAGDQVLRDRGRDRDRALSRAGAIADLALSLRGHDMSTPLPAALEPGARRGGLRDKDMAVAVAGRGWARGRGGPADGHVAEFAVDTRLNDSQSRVAPAPPPGAPPTDIGLRPAGRGKRQQPV